MRTSRDPSRALVSAASLVASLMALVLLLAPATRAAPPDELKGSYDRTVRFLQDAQNADGGFSSEPGGESDPFMTAWCSLALAGAGINPQDQARPGGVSAYTWLTERIGEVDGVTTDYERLLLIAAAAGTNPRDFGGVDLVTKIVERQREDGSFPHVAGGPPGVNDTAFAVISLSTVQDPALRPVLVRALDWLESVQRESGAWPSFSLTSGSSTDMTGAVLEAFVAGGRRTGAAQTKAMDWLRSVQHDDGGFGEADPGGASNSASTAWVSQGLWALGIDPRTWTKPRGNPLTYLASLQQEDGSILYMRTDAGDDATNRVWMTGFVAPALAAQPLPIPEAPRAAPTTPPPPAPADQGVLAGGGGEGAPLFSRPQQQSRGTTAGGVRRTSSTKSRHDTSDQTTRKRRAAAAQRSKDAPEATVPDPVTPPAGTATTTPPAAAEPEAGRGGDGDATSTGNGGGSASIPSSGAAAPGTQQVTGNVLGQQATPGEGDDRAAPGLRAAAIAEDTDPATALTIAGLLVLAAIVGAANELRRPRNATHT